MDEAAALAEAIALARGALVDDAGGPFGAVVLRAGAIVGRGRNRVLQDRDPTAHAEVLAIRDACRRLGTPALEGATLVATSEPCPMCLGAAYWARVARIVFAVDREGAASAGFDDARFYEDLARPPEDRRVPQVHLPTPAADEVLQAWAARPDRRTY